MTTCINSKEQLVTAQWHLALNEIKDMLVIVTDLVEKG